MSIQFKTIKELSSMLRSKEVSNYELLQETFELVKEYKNLNAFITLNEENALKKAIDLDNNPSDQTLSCIPIAQKDLFFTKDFRTTC